MGNRYVPRRSGSKNCSSRIDINLSPVPSSRCLAAPTIDPPSHFDASKNIASMPYVSTIGHGGTSNIAARDVYGNVSFNSIATSVDGHAAIGTITLTIGSPQNQVFSSGSGTAIVMLPDATTLITGWLYTINNNATGLIHVQASGTGTDLFTVPPGGSPLRIY